MRCVGVPMMTVIAIAALVYLLFLCLIVWVSLHPKRLPFFISPGLLGAPQSEVEFSSRDGVTLRGWWIEAAEPKAVVVLVHGYIMNRSEMTPVAYHLWRLGCSCLVFDLRAHGRSGGSSTGLGWLERADVAAAIAWASARHPDTKVAVIGSSMGGAAAAFALGYGLARPDAVVLDSAYSTLDSAVLGWWRFLGGKTLAWILAPTLLLSAVFVRFRPRDVDVARALSQAPETPVLILHGKRDNLALPSQALRNFEACRRGTLEWFDNCGHSEGRLNQPEKYLAVLQRFLEEHGVVRTS